MTQVRWHYEHSIYDETSSLLFLFQGANAHVTAHTPCGEDGQGRDLTERFVKGKEVELGLEFVACCPTNSPSLPEDGWPYEEFGGLHLDQDTCKTVHEGSIQDLEIDPNDWAQELKEFGDDDFNGTGLVRRLPPQDGEPCEIRFEVHRDTATGIVASLLSHGTLTDFLTFQIFSQIAPDSFRFASPQVIDTDAENAGDARALRFVDRLKPPTLGEPCLTGDVFVELLKVSDARISYRQLYEVLPCKPQTMKEYLVNSGLAEKGVRLTNQTFSSSELVSDLVAYLHTRKPLGDKAYRLIRLFDKTGLISPFGVD
jgi:hypothetical protein